MLLTDDAMIRPAEQPISAAITYCSTMMGRVGMPVTRAPFGLSPAGAQNCINLPGAINEQAIGGEPTMIGPEGEPINPMEGGRMDIMRRYAAQSEEALAASGLNVTPTAPAMWARAGVGVVKVGGVVLMLYSARRSIARIADAPEAQTGQVVGEEGGSWIGGFIGNALASALGGAFACSESGPEAFFCALGFGLVGGATGSVVGGDIGGDVGEAFDSFRNMTDAERNEAIVCWPDRNSPGCRAFHEMQAIERGDDPSDPMSGF